MRHFLDIADWQATEISQMLTNAQRLKSELKKNGTNEPVLKGKTLAMVFEKPSLRTRASFDVGIQQLGGFSIYLKAISVCDPTRPDHPCPKAPAQN